MLVFPEPIRLFTGMLLGLLCLLTGSIQAAGTPGAGAETAPEGQTAGEAALALYQAGITYKEAAWAREAEAAAAGSDSAREAHLAAAQAAYREAVKAQGKALKLHLNYHEAANELGYALRKTGEPRKALGAYNFALQIKPDFYPAIEYRGEAYLALGMLDEAKAAYMTLFRNDLDLAGQLLEAMAKAAQARDDPAFAAWVADRQRLAALTPDAGIRPDADW